MIKVENVCKAFDSVEVLSNVSLSIEQGEFVAITGKSGSGKSTLLNIIGALESCDSGRVLVEGKNLEGLTEREAAAIRSQSFGYIFQSFHLEPTYSVYKNVEIPLLIARVPKQEREQRVLAVLDRVGLKHMHKKTARVLSGGEKQRVAIARALSNNPKIILADEPTGNLDTANGKIVIGMLRELANEGITVVLVTHSTEDASAADRILHIEDGRIDASSGA